MLSYRNIALLTAAGFVIAALLVADQGRGERVAIALAGVALFISVVNLLTAPDWRRIEADVGAVQTDVATVRQRLETMATARSAVQPRSELSRAELAAGVAIVLALLLCRRRGTDP